ncbi:MAG: hypothetical protein QXI71_03535 [Candidatus Bathyarchaeia archaeon]
MTVFSSMLRGTGEINQTRLSNIWQKMCEYLGISKYKAKVYIALIEFGYANARTLSIEKGEGK